MMRFSKFLKVEAEIVVARQSLVMDETKKSVEPVIFFHPEFAKRSGVKEGDVVEVEANSRVVRLKAKISENAPENGAIIPNGIFASYLASFDGFKKFKANIEVTEGEPSSVEEILGKIKS
ncbi:molybdopterin dinucleotide binding domain-containing protein [Archaeoglobus neptunius]|uniref:molybdopterin dinucleotide binding domain-containing protein n=1 Tax=Archaeoglobus neptunius TaxID=2798580 RepID=UPI001E52FAC4|nr:molybdopterin dinucleotide binding domain-containing protein [Archaeoglobus neptunius]